MLLGLLYIGHNISRRVILRLATNLPRCQRKTVLKSVINLMKNKVKYYKNIMGKKDDDAMILPDLPPEIIYEILVNIPPHYLQQLRLVCKSWKNMFTTNNFILDNFARNNNHFLVQRHSIWRRDKVYRMEIDEKQLNYKLHEIKLSRRMEGKFISSCFGMLLREKKYVLQVLNLSTRRCLTLPEFVIQVAYINI